MYKIFNECSRLDIAALLTAEIQTEKVHRNKSIWKKISSDLELQFSRTESTALMCFIYSMETVRFAVYNSF